MMRTPIVVTVAVLLLVAACSGKPDIDKAATEDAAVTTDSGWTVVTAEELTEAQDVQRQRGLDAIQSMTGQLMGELTAALDEDGPDGAIQVCSMRAPEIAAAVSNEYGLLLGRTSHRLRNPANAPPEWAVPLVRDQVADPTWLVGPDGQIAGFLPIHLKAECGMCHGPREEIADEVATTIEQFYPEDVATGFAEGDLRGWIWVETPAG